MYPIETRGGELATERHKEHLILRPCLMGQARNDARGRLVGSAGGKGGPMSGIGQLLWFNTRGGQDVLKRSGGNYPPAVDRYNCVSAGIVPVPKNQMAAFCRSSTNPKRKSLRRSSGALSLGRGTVTRQPLPPSPRARAREGHALADTPR